METNEYIEVALNETNVCQGFYFIFLCRMIKILTVSRMKS